MNEMAWFEVEAFINDCVFIMRFSSPHPSVGFTMSRSGHSNCDMVDTVASSTQPQSSLVHFPVIRFLSH
jgi:hypothetical protein